MIVSGCSCRLHNSRFPQHFVCKARMGMFSSAPVFVVSFASCLGFSRNDIYYAVADEFGVASARGFAAIPSSLLAAEREEAKAVLSLFLRKQGLSNAVAARTINKSDCFIDHLISMLHTKHKSRYLVGSNSNIRIFSLEIPMNIPRKIIHAALHDLIPSFYALLRF